MAVKFLSDDWSSAVTSALNESPGFKSAIGAADLGLQFNVTDGPDGDVAYFLKAAGGNAEFGMGEVAEPDVTIGQSYETATAIFKGDLNVQTAFMTGKLKVAGNLAKLMMHQGAISQWQAATSEIDVEY